IAQLEKARGRAIDLLSDTPTFRAFLEEVFPQLCETLARTYLENEEFEKALRTLSANGNMLLTLLRLSTSCGELLSKILMTAAREASERDDQKTVIKFLESRDGTI